MEKDPKKEFPFGEYLKTLRQRKGVSLKKVEDDTGVPNAYLSQLETGTRRRIPSSKRLNVLADYYNVSVQQLLEKAGYFNKADIKETEEDKIKKSFLQAIGDPRFKHGMRIKNKNDLDYMRFINEIYEELEQKDEILRDVIFGIGYFEIILKMIKQAEQFDKNNFLDFQSSMIEEIKNFIKNKQANKETVVFPMIDIPLDIQKKLEKYFYSKY